MRAEERALNSNLYNVPFSPLFAGILVNLTKTSSLEEEKGNYFINSSMYFFKL